MLDENSGLIVEIIELNNSIKHGKGNAQLSEFMEKLDTKRKILNKNLMILAKWADEASDTSPRTKPQPNFPNHSTDRSNTMSQAHIQQMRAYQNRTAQAQMQVQMHAQAQAQAQARAQAQAQAQAQANLQQARAQAQVQANAQAQALAQYQARMASMGNHPQYMHMSQPAPMYQNNEASMSMGYQDVSPGMMAMSAPQYSGSYPSLNQHPLAHPMQSSNPSLPTIIPPGSG